MVVRVTMVWLEHPVTAYEDSLDSTVRSISTNVCQAHAVMEVAAWTRMIVSIVCALQEQEGAIVNRVRTCNKKLALFHDP